MKKTKKEGRELDFEVEEEEENREPTDEELAELEEVREELLEDTLKREQHPVLSREEERELLSRAAAGDDNAVEELMNRNKRLVLKIANKYRYNQYGVDFQDLVQAGMEGLFLAIRRFDVEKGTRLSTYATPWIRQKIYNEIKTHAPFYYSMDEYKRLKTINEKIREIEQMEGRKPKIEELSALLELPVEKIELLLQRQATVSIDQKAAPEDDDRNYGDFVWDPEAEEKLEKIEREDQVDYVRSFLPDALDIVCQRLSPRERSIVEYHFGVGRASGPHSCQETADDLKTSIEKVKELSAFFLRGLKRMMDEDSESFT